MSNAKDNGKEIEMKLFFGIKYQHNILSSIQGNEAPIKEKYREFQKLKMLAHLQMQERMLHEPRGLVADPLLLRMQPQSGTPLNRSVNPGDRLWRWRR